MIFQPLIIIVLIHCFLAAQQNRQTSCLSFETKPKSFMMRKLIWLLICILPFLSGCRKDEEQFSSTRSSQGFVPPEITVNGSVAGSVIDESGQPVAGISVSAGDAVTQTDADGLYLFNDIPLNTAGTPVQVDDPAYWRASRLVVPRHNAVHHTHITLMNKEVKGSFRGDEDGTVGLAEGMELHFEAYSLLDHNGEVYTDDVILTARMIPVSNSEDVAKMPGELRGTDESDRIRALRSRGMFAGIVHGPGGNILQPDASLPATMTFTPQPGAASPPPVLGVWYLDEAAGYWRKSGEAVKEGDSYRAEIPHFSFWGLFEDFDPVSVTGTVTGAADNPVADAQVSFLSDGQFITSVFTDNQGVFQATLPSGPEFDAVITDACNVPVFTENIGSLPDDTDLGTFAVPAEDFTVVTVSGSAVNCAGDGISTNYATVCSAAGCAQLFLDGDGNFEQTFGLCGEGQLAFFFFDQATGESVTVTAQSEAVLDLGQVELCNSPAEEFISMTVNGETTFYPNPFSVATTAQQQVRATDSNFNISIGWLANVFVTGNFSGNDVEFEYLEYVPNFGATELIQASCEFAECDNIEVVIETYDLASGVIEGSYSGTILYTSSIEGEQPDTPIEGEFRVGF